MLVPGPAAARSRPARCQRPLTASRAGSTAGSRAVPAPAATRWRSRATCCGSDESGTNWYQAAARARQAVAYGSFSDFTWSHQASASLTRPLSSAGGDCSISARTASSASAERRSSGRPPAQSPPIRQENLPTRGPASRSAGLALRAANDGASRAYSAWASRSCAGPGLDPRGQRFVRGGAGQRLGEGGGADGGGVVAGGGGRVGRPQRRRRQVPRQRRRLRGRA